MNLEEIGALLQQLLETQQQLVDQVPLSAKGFFTLKHAAEYSGLSVESLRRLCESGKLTALRPVKGRIVVDRLELEAYIRSCTSTPRTGRGRHRSE